MRAFVKTSCPFRRDGGDNPTIRVALARSLLAAVLVLVLAFVAAKAVPAQEGRAQENRVQGETPNIGRAIHLVSGSDSQSAGLVIDLTREATARFEVLENPDRIVIDLDGVVFPGSAALSSSKGQGPVSAWRAGLVMLGQSRIVLDLAKPAIVERIDVVRQAGVPRLVVQIHTTDRGRFAERAAADRAKRGATRNAARAETPAPRDARAKPLLVIDPGHGGIDPGASGLKGEAEKDIVLAVAKALKAVIEQDGRIEVQLTREDDRFIPLGERVAFGRVRGAALFVSLHADSLVGERDVRGASVYTLSDRASDANAARAAEKENRADLLAGVDVSEEQKEGVDDILFDLARRETRLFSQIVARRSVAALETGSRVHKTPLRSAGFRVLRAPDMPSILVELGYLSNPDDLTALSLEGARGQLAKSLGKALVEFVMHGRNAVSGNSPG